MPFETPAMQGLWVTRIKEHTFRNQCRGWF